jgi:curved DNA-binding protein CbpA
MAQDPYAILGVSRGASEKDIKSAYRKLAKELHPDHNKDNPKAAERFSEVTRAYDLLSDKDKRAQFDRGEIDGEGNPAGFGGGFGAGGFGVALAAAVNVALAAMAPRAWTLAIFLKDLWRSHRRRGGFGGGGFGVTPRPRDRTAPIALR